MNPASNSAPLVSILVPTWNRVAKLRQLLDVLLPAVHARLELDLVISDNSSTDGTDAFLASLPAHPRIRFIRQPINYGPNLHLAWLYGQARGKYLWMIGDDDMVEPDLPGIVIEKLQADPALGLFHLPHRAYPPNAPAFQSNCPPAILRVQRARELFGQYIVWMTFISGNVMRTDLVHAALPLVTFATAYWPMDLLVRATANHPAAVLNQCKITAGTEITWANDEFAISNFDYPTAILQCPVLSRREKSACLHNRYDLAPEFLDRLVLHNPRLMLEIFLVAPSLCSVSFFLRLIRKGARRLSGARPPKPQVPAEK